MQLPELLLSSLEGIKSFDRKAFEAVHNSGEQITSIRINPLKLSESSKVLPFGEDLGGAGGAIPWSQYGYYLSQRPSFTFDPLFHAGCYYVQEASSMFLEQALQQSVDLSKPLKVLDLCAAPGGKSTHIQSLISKESLLVSNEVIKARATILKDNIIKWGGGNVIITNNDPKDFARLENYFDVIVVDAPCSGSGLFRRDPDAINEWSENNVQLCCQRQQRIVADILPALKKDGILIYSTCSYSKQEDEDISCWLKEEWEMENVKLKIEDEWEIIETDGGYRFWPDKVKGEGFFISCFKKTEGEDESYLKYKSKQQVVSKNETEIIKQWVKTEGLFFFKNQQKIIAFPELLQNELNLLSSFIRIIYSGITIGEIIRDKLIPDHALSVSSIISENVKSTEMEKDLAIKFLQRKDFNFDFNAKGWQLITYKGHNLGWINVLPNRFNNYYPKEMRILKDK